MKILGISAWFHDSSAAILVDGNILAAAEEERFSRVKHDSSFPSQAISWCLASTGISLDELDAVVFYEKPFLKFERILETFYAQAPRGIRSFLLAMPHWFGDKLFIKRKLRKGLRAIQSYDQRSLKILFAEHHLSHAAGAYFSSGYDHAAILTIDGVGEWTTASIMEGRDHQIRMIKELTFPHSIGLLYSAFTQFLGFRVNNGEYKVMGLAAYGHRDHPDSKRFYELIRKEVVTVFEDGSIRLNLKLFGFLDSRQTIRPKKWEALFGVPMRSHEDPILPSHLHLASAIQQLLEEIVLRLGATAQSLTGASKVCLSGGVALNCVANGVLADSGIFEEVFVQPAPGDSGGALGAAMAFEFISSPETSLRAAGLPLWGPNIDESVVPALCEELGLAWNRVEDEDLFPMIADLLAKQQIIGWCQGRMEFGPRALGNRSILADPRSIAIKKQINTLVKKRESFRPFAPAILEEKLEEYFAVPSPSPWMQLVHQIREPYRAVIPPDSAEWDLTKLAALPTSDMAAVTHVDFSARIQSVNSSEHPRFHRLIKAFHQQTGCPMVVNTSFNVRGEPIVCTAEDAIRCMHATQMDVLVIGNQLIRRESVS